MSNRLWHLALVAALVACTNGKDEPDPDTDTNPPAETDAPDETDASDETDAPETDAPDETDVPDDTDETPVATSCVLTGTLTELTTRETTTLTVTADDGTGATWDATSRASFSVDDDDIVQVYTGSVGQPLWPGSTTITADVDGVSCTLDVAVTVVAAEAGDLVFNEVLVDPDGDPNGDGTSDSVEDEFVEIANVSDVTIDLGGAYLRELDFFALPRHTFAADTLLRAGEAIVVFGGGDVSSLSAMYARIEVAVNTDAGLIWGLNLNDDQERLELVSPGGTVLAELSYGGSSGVTAPSAESLTRNPDVWGTTWEPHSTAGTGSESPGTWSDGSSFEGPDARYTP